MPSLRQERFAGGGGGGGSGEDVVVEVEGVVVEVEVVVLVVALRLVVFWLGVACSVLGWRIWRRRWYDVGVGWGWKRNSP